MRGVEQAVDDDGAVEMGDRSAIDLFPHRDLLAGFLVVFGDQPVVDDIEIVGVDANPLICFGDIESADRLGGDRFLRARRERHQGKHDDGGQKMVGRSHDQPPD